MQIQSLQLFNFKNYESVTLDLSARVNVLVGKNGSGKTNLLDAIHYLSLTKSAISSSDNFCIRQGEPFFVVKGLMKMADKVEELTCSVQSGSKKVFREGAIEYQKISDHIGKYPVVLIAPDDTDLVKEGSEPRRKFFDSIISQLDRAYLENLMQYNYALKQRNGLLKIFAEKNYVDNIALESYDQILVKLGSEIFKRRKIFAEEFLPAFRKYYQFIVDHEVANLEYISDLNKQDVQTGLNQNRKRDLATQRTNFGIHRDDYYFTLGNGDLKRLGSQGQQKSFVIALKLAQFSIIHQHKNFKPILLLDDIFDKLDDYRIGRLLELIKDDELGQLFITDARPDRTAALLKSIDVASAVFKVDAGSIRLV